MKLKKVSIKDFRSIVNITHLFLEKNITTLVGANEHGKSNILQALRFLDPNIPLTDPIDHRLDSKSVSHFPSIAYTLELNAEDQALIEGYFLSAFDNVPGETNELLKSPEIPEEIIFIRNADVTKPHAAVQGFTDPFHKILLNFITDKYKDKVIYFDDFDDRLISVISDAELQNEKNLIVNGLLKVSGLIDVRTRLFETNPQIRYLIGNASERFTDEITGNWIQGKKDELKLTLYFYSDTKTMRIDIQDNNTYGDLETRSRGFKWFLSFFLKYRSYSDGELKDCLFLLDEPGLFLHPRGQKDLMNFFEVFSRHNQIVYTTHFPFMISRLNQQRVRVIEKAGTKGTLVDAKSSRSNWRPLRTSLGIALSDSFYYAENTLLVEGQEDRIYILSLLKLFGDRESIKIDLNILSIMDAGGSTELPAMARILHEEERPLIVLIDSDSPKELARLNNILPSNKIKEIKFFDDNSITIQDLLPTSLFQLAVNRYIDELAKEDIIEKRPGITFAVTKSTNINKDVNEFVKKNYGVERISKVGLANQFERIILDRDFSFNPEDFKKSFKLIKWVVDALNLKVE